MPLSNTSEHLASPNPMGQDRINTRTKASLGKVASKNCLTFPVRPSNRSHSKRKPPAHPPQSRKRIKAGQSPSTSLTVSTPNSLPQPSAPSNVMTMSASVTTMPLGLPLQNSSQLLNPSTPFDTNTCMPIDVISYMATVYDNVFMHQFSGLPPIQNAIRSSLLKKLVIDHANFELITRNITNFEDLYEYTLVVFRRSGLIP